MNRPELLAELDRLVAETAAARERLEEAAATLAEVRGALRVAETTAASTAESVSAPPHSP